MLFTFACPKCGTRLEADAAYSGTLAECPRCDIGVHVPDPRIGPGTTVGGHRLERLIGRGGMGEVYLATQIAMDRQVAVKILSPALTADAAFVSRFLVEVRTAARLDHPNIVAALDAGDDAGVYYLAMAFVDGETLQAVLDRDGHLPEREVLEVAAKVARGLGYAWKRFRLLHRDIKPSNLMRDRAGKIKLMDLGVAKIVGEETGLTLTGVALGTPNYMSPEQVRGDPGTDCRADIYSLGCTMYHLLTGNRPFVGENALQVMDQHVNAPVPSVWSCDRSISPPVERLVRRFMAKDPDARPQDWEEASLELSYALAGRRPRLWSWRLLARRVRRRPVVAASLAAAGLLLVAGAWLGMRYPFSAVPAGAAPPAAGAVAGDPDAGGAAIPAPDDPATPESAGWTLLTTRLAEIARLLVEGDSTAALTAWQAEEAALAGQVPPQRLAEVTGVLDAAVDIPAFVMQSFERDTGREVAVRLGGGLVFLTIDGVDTGRVSGRRVEDGVTVPVSFGFRDLDPEEAMRRLGPENDAVAETLRGLLMLAGNRPMLAIMSLKRARCPLAEAILAAVDRRRPQPTPSGERRVLSLPFRAGR